MQQETGRLKKTISWGVFASLLLHAVLFAAFLVHFSPAQPEPPAEESVAVELVPPPEEPVVEEPEPEAPPEPKAEEPVKPEEAETPELPPPPPEEKPEEKPPAEQPPEPPPAEPPPAEPPPVEEPAAEEPPPAPAPAEEEPPAGNEDEGRLRVLDPVVQFGEKDTGPRQSEEGEVVTDAGTPPPDAPELPEVPEAEPAAATPMPDDIALPEVELGANSSQEPGPEALSDAAKTEIIAAVPKEKPSDTPPVEAPPALTEAKTLFSRKDRDDPVAMRDMTNLSRSARADRLCLTELREQLRHASPPYDPELLPSFGLKEGTVLDIPTAAFRADGQWYNLSFRCEVDEEVTKVMTFGFNVGTAVPRRDWKSRGFPSF
ncbi:DUF930 domain-containing protein [Agrobacterium sp. a22-2]|uniref:DUF930 domain-containing protein n=1 Tax=Agrobacterium sp. a22-2 TaxID=2283840 RepID=UPI0014472FEE|nr:DUF930 domain-containing protein [Agrobacterium sp. a22-2]NKN38449.1 DUF930 domain-containing protein [Agrobacterium sp. a22-2]